MVAAWATLWDPGRTGDRTAVDPEAWMAIDVVPALRDAAAGASQTRLRLHRIGMATTLVVGLALVVGLPSGGGGVDVRVGQPAEDSVPAPREVRVVDSEATEVARRVAAESVDATLAVDATAGQDLVNDLRAVFESTREVRRPLEVGVGPGQSGAPTAGAADDEVGRVVPDVDAQRESLRLLLVGVPAPTVAALVAVSDADLDVVERETISIAQLLARQRIREDAVAQVLEETLEVELGLRSPPADTGLQIVEPLLQTYLRPNVVVDLAATAEARELAAAAVNEISQVWLPGQFIIRQGEIVSPLQSLAISGLDVGRVPLWRTLVTGAAAGLLLVGVGGIYLSRMQPFVWRSVKKLWLLALLLVMFAAIVTGIDLLVDSTGSTWAFVVPVGALAMLIAILIHPVVGLASMLPAVVTVLLVDADSPGVALFAAAAVLVTVPLTRGIASRADLKRAVLRAGLSYPLLAVTIVLVFGPREEFAVAALAGALNGIVTALIVQGALPALESLFRLPTVTALLDLADRNHPLLRELEQEALGSYNHSVMVASLVERACRAIGADPMLGSVAALYHDIGKVRQPHFFIENQQGIANPHDGLEPEVSALIIMNHVVDGVELATSYRLPPEVVACIGSHHGTMLVKYFYEEAVERAGGDHAAVDEGAFRYRGHRPRSREAAVLLLADSCEATTRAMAMSRGNLPRDEIEATVDRLLEERRADGQFDDAEITLRELRIVRDTIVESLVGIYHPRIAYPATRPVSPSSA
jgi:putative nucleotidyltransferase with HDIG domain